MLTWLDPEPAFLAFRLFSVAVYSIPLFLVSHLLLRSSSSTESALRAVVAGSVFGTFPSEFLCPRELIYWLRDNITDSANALLDLVTYYAFDLLVALLVEIVLVSLFRLAYRRLANSKYLPHLGRDRIPDNQTMNRSRPRRFAVI
ncbi:hypothetical protein Q31b_36210 [Novipirellula aureliae]|uniref:Uncharacterized protein n=1 Tax=Novipirellula aureliae TaxID=2527966 RepID=A0A5C6DVF8_9BACT|nr:hypothetical protein Q31b_36210 [Novipirellula aureliae]